MLITPCAGMAGSESKYYIYKGWGSILPFVHASSIYQESMMHPPPGIGKKHTEQNIHGPMESAA